MKDELDYTRILGIISGCDDPEKLINIAQNSQRKNVDHVRFAAFEKLNTLIPQFPNESFEAGFWQMFTAYQNLLLDFGRPVIRLNRARKKAQSDGEEEALIRWVSNSAQPWAFQTLIEQGDELLTAESLVIRFSERFDVELVEQAKKRINDTKRQSLETA